MQGELGDEAGLDQPQLDLRDGTKQQGTQGHVAGWQAEFKMAASQGRVRARSQDRELRGPEKQEEKNTWFLEMRNPDGHGKFLNSIATW